MSQPTRNVPLVVFSGGLDSTMVLIDVLKNNEKVDVVSVILQSQVSKATREKAARDKILSEIEGIQEQLKGKIRHSDEIEMPDIVSGHYTVTQPVLWLNSIASVVRADTDWIHLGYVKGDDILPCIGNMKAAWDNIAVMSRMKWYLTDLPLLHFPVMDLTKRRIISDMPGNILRHVSWCESLGHRDDCGECSSCRRMISEMAALRVLNPMTFSQNALKGRYLSMIRKLNRKNRSVSDKVK